MPYDYELPVFDIVSWSYDYLQSIIISYLKYSNISLTKSDVNIHLGKAWTTIDNLSTMYKSLPSRLEL